MRIQYDPDFIEELKKLNIRIRKSFKKRIKIFEKNSFDPQLNNHFLRHPYKGLRSIEITNDYRAIYEEIKIEDNLVAYFLFIGTHGQLYKSN